MTRASASKPGSSTSWAEGGLSLGRLLVYTMALCSAGAGIIHLRAAGAHTEHTLMFAGFLVMAAAQLALAGFLMFRASVKVVWAGIAGTLAIIGTWVASRITGFGFVPGAESRQAIEAVDMAATMLGVGVVAAGALYLVLPATAAVMQLAEVAGRRAMTAVGVVVAVLLVPGLVVPHDPDHGHGHDHTQAAAHLHDQDHGDADHARGGGHGHDHGGQRNTHGTQALAQGHSHGGGSHNSGDHGVHADHGGGSHNSGDHSHASGDHGDHGDHGSGGHGGHDHDFSDVDPDTYAAADHPAYGYDPGPSRAANYVMPELFGCHVDHPYIAWLVDTVADRVASEFPTITHALLSGYIPMSPVPNDFGYPDTYWHWWNLAIGPQNDERDEIVQPHNWIEYLLMVPAYWPDTGESITDLWSVRGVMFASPVPDKQGPELYPGCNPFHNHTEETDGLVEHDHFHMWPWHHVHPFAMNPAHLCDDKGESVDPVYPKFFRDLSGDWDCTHAHHGHEHEH